MNTSRPPRLATRLLESLLPEDQREAVVGDLTEAFERDVAGSPLRARLTFWRETFAALVQLQVGPADAGAYIPYMKESLVQSFLSDVRRAVRSLARAPGFAALCAVTLALSIGATTAIMSVAKPLLLQAVPYPNADRLVMVNERMGDGSASNIGYMTYADLRESSRSLEHSAAFGTWEPTVFGERDGERLRGLRVSWEFFRTLGVRPALGRDFLPEDDTPDTYNVVILSHALWMQRFAGDSAILGKHIDLGATKPIVIGVLPASFDNVIDPTSRIYRALGYAKQDWACRSCRHLRVVGRVRENTSKEDAGRELTALMGRLAADHPQMYPGAGVIVERLAERVTKNTRTIVVVTMGAVAVLLLIAIANVVNLQLARAARREEEFAVRAALGAGRGRIARQLLAEGLVIASAGAVLGVIVALAILPTIVASLPASLPRVSAIAFDWQVLAMVAAIVLVVALALGMIPAMSAGRYGLFDTLRSGGRGSSGAMHRRTRSSLVVAEVALAMMLLVGATLLGRSLVRLLDVDLGYDPSSLVTMVVQATGPAYDSTERIFANHDAIRSAVRAVPGVIEVGLTSQLPLSGQFDRYGVRDRASLSEEGADADRYAVSPDFMRAMRIRILQGREFTEAESRDTASRVAIVSQALARRMWPAGDAIGKYVRAGGDTRPFFQVVGIAADVRHTGIDETVSQQLYIPERQWFWADDMMVLVVRVAGDPASALSAIHSAVRSVDPLQPITKIATMEQVVARSTAQRRVGAILFTSFGGLALLLAAAGIYGVLAGLVATRTREIGVRAALGATPARISALVLREAALLATVGLVLGGASALALSRYLRSLLFSIDATDPVSLAAAAVVVGGAALVASALPALRASSVDPIIALRQ